MSTIILKKKKFKLIILPFLYLHFLDTGNDWYLFIRLSDGGVHYPPVRGPNLSDQGHLYFSQLLYGRQFPTEGVRDLRHNRPL